MFIEPRNPNAERQEQVLRLIEQQGHVSVTGICDQFSVSLATARRDLEALAELGRVQRIYGGAIAIRKAPPEAPALQRAAEHAEEKERIGWCAAELVTDGETIFLGSGTTVVEVARHLRDRHRLTVITNSLLVINVLADRTDLTLISLGGIFRASEMSFIGHVAEQALAEVHADKVFMGIRAVDLEHGLTNEYLPESLTDRAIWRIGREVIVVADHSKCGSVSAVFVAPLSSMHTLITGVEVTAEFAAALTAQGSRVLTV
jgi:DeoR family transcriptional regulator, aga operon transcriptional repressor